MNDEQTATIHELKTVRPFFVDVWAGDKTAELRKMDRPYRVGDLLDLREYLPEDAHYTGYRILARITHMVTDADGPWLAPDHCMLSMRVLERKP